MTRNRSDTIRLQRFDDLLELFSPGRAIDLGAGRGNFAQRAASRGWDVLAVDARADRFPEESGETITWSKEDVRDVDFRGFDLIFNLGLFYHLTLEDQLSLLDRAVGIPMILDTHVGDGGEAQHFSLSDLTTQKGYEGRIYSEEEIQDVSTASFGNLHSFWPTSEALTLMLFERGWDVLHSMPYYRSSRTFFLCLPRTSI